MRIFGLEISVKNATRGASSHPRNPSPWLIDFFGGRNAASGVNITEKSALQVADVYKCVRVLSEAVAMLPLKTYERMQPRGKKLAVDHPLYNILHDEPNDNMTSFTFREALMSHVLIWGNAYAYIERNRGGRVVALWPLKPHTVKVCYGDNGLTYEVRPEGVEAETFMADEILHVPGLSYDGIKGYSPIQLQMEAFGLSKATELYGAAFFGNGGQPGIVLKIPGAIKKEALERLKESWKEMHQGVGNAHRVAILEDGLTPEKISVSPNEAQFLESRQFSRADIAGIFRVPPHKIGDLSRSTNNNIEQQALEFVGDAVAPWLERWEQECYRKLFSPLEKKKYFIEFEMKGMLRGDTAARTEHYQKMFNIGAYSPNDIRESENLNPIEGGDTYYVPLNMVPADLAREMLETQMEGTGATEPDQDPTEPTPAPAPDTETEAKTTQRYLARFKASYRAVFRDAVGRIIKRTGAARSTYAAAIVLPVLQALTEGVNGSISQENQAFLDEFSSGLAQRAASWKAENADEIAENELERAIAALTERGVAA